MKPNWQSSFEELQAVLNGHSVYFLVSVFLLMLVNWGLEARKWQISLVKVQKLSFSRAFRAIFTGNTMAIFTPNRIGEYMGRMLYLREGSRLQSIGITLICSIGQLLVTLSMGFAGMIFLRPELAKTLSGSGMLWIDMLMYFVGAAVLFVGAVYFRFSIIIRWLERMPLLQKYLRYLQVLDSFNATLLLRVLSLSVLRYLVFVLQYYLLFRIFEVDISWWQCFCAMSMVFLILAIIPSVAMLSDLGIRWKASIELVQLFSVNSMGIFASSLTIWLINLVVPALLGSLLILSVKLFKTTNVKVNETVV